MRRRHRRLLGAVLLAGALVVSISPAAQAHGEKSQEAFLRMTSVGWVDVKFSQDHVKQGETFTITGTAKVLDAWPTGLAKGAPNTGFISVIAPGPVVMVKERTINGVSAPDRIDIHKGGIYEFSMTVAGRRAGTWHVHPSFSVKGAGTLLGPGMWITVEKNPAGYSNPITLDNGKTINLENYQLPFTWIWLLITFVIGVAWMIYWTVPKRTVTNLAVTSQIPLNTDGMEYGLITKRDHRNMNWFAIGTALLLVVGWLYQAAAFPTKMPQQVIQFAPPQPAIASAPQFAKASNATATYDRGSKTFTMNVDVTNSGKTAMTLKEFTTTNLNFVPGTPGPLDRQMQVAPTTTVDPGATTKLTLTTHDSVWQDEHLLTVGSSQLEVTGILVFDDADGARNLAEVQAIMQPQFK
jgi:methane/ammonia monooxygenase subunit B